MKMSDVGQMECSHCGAVSSAKAVLCYDCGRDLRTGVHPSTGGTLSEVSGQLCEFARTCPACNARVVDLEGDYCSSCGSQLPELRAADLLPHLRHLQKALVEQGLARALPETSLLSENFLARAFAVYGHALVAALIIGVPVYLAALFVALG